MDVKSLAKWSAADWINRGSSILASDPDLAQKFISHGLMLDPSISIGWFNLGIAKHQKRRIQAAIRTYQHALRPTPTPGCNSHKFESGSPASRPIPRRMVYL